ncbi:MAG: hypothetical protein JOZ89_01700, partial [Gammaproteobacteria bacterium]|nr:hypothetical protein [Gammaproteobacteria bacterium]
MGEALLPGLAGNAQRPGRALLRLVLPALGAVTIFLAIVIIAFEVAAARAPEHRAALEELIRHETGLEVSFSELSLGWGWHGPEAVFHAVVLEEPGGGTLLRAPRVGIALDLWRMARTGRLEAGRMTLEDADVDLTGRARAIPGDRAPAATRPLAGAAVRAAAQSHAAEKPDDWSVGARILSHWRGGVIEIDRGSIRGLLPGAATLLTVRHALLRRAGADWNADARVLLPESLGTSANLLLQMSGDLEKPASVSGTLRLEGERFELGGWRTLAPEGAQRYLPEAGSGNFGLRLSFAAGRLLGASGTFHAERLEWAPLAPSLTPLTLERLRGVWQLGRRDDGWHVKVRASEPAMLSADFVADGTHFRGYARHLPLGALTLLARGSAPAPILGEVSLDGLARELRFDFDAQRPAGARLMTRVELSGLTVGTRARDVRLGGLSGRLFGTESHLQATLDSPAASLLVSGTPGGPPPQPGERLARDQRAAEPPMQRLEGDEPVVQPPESDEPAAQRLEGDEPAVQRLDGVEVSARLALDVSGNGGWQLKSENLLLRHAGAQLTARGVIGTQVPGALPRLSAHVEVKDTDMAILARLLGPQRLRALGPVAARLTGGHIESAALDWRGAAASTLLGDASPGAFTAALTGAVALHNVSLARDELWPDAQGIDAHILVQGPRVHMLIGH